jgi:uncharacterized protein (TIGR04222 family)
MTSEQADLWQRILDFSIDGPELGALTFARRLARENGWSDSQAERAILEYKRFVFLAHSAGHQVCPSEQVDQVWHAHLTYTRSYWDRFCEEVLGRPLHHEPTRGGPAEAAKHEQMYESTLASYRRLFASAPPADLWPPGAIRFGEDAQHRQVNTQRNWVVPKRPFRRALGALTLLAGAGLASGCVQPVIGDAQVDREEFLLIYVLALIGAFALAMVIRRTLRQPEYAIQIEEGELDVYDYALLAGGPVRVFDVGLVQLLESGAVSHNDKDKFFATGPLPDKADAIAQHLYELIAHGGESGRLLDVIRKSVQFDLEARKEHLRELGLLLSDSRAGFSYALPLLIMLVTTIGLGVGRTVAGVAGHKPTCFLMLLMAVGLFVTVKVFGTRSRRTARGDAFLATINAKPPLRYDSDPTRRDIILATALVGTAALAATEHESVAKLLHPKTDPTSSGGGCGSGCGGSACGGGGCGGGGCGGGCGGGGD